MADPKAALAEIQKKYGGGTTESTSRTSRSTGSAAGAKDALAAIQQKYAPQTRTASSYQSQNAGHERSGLTRDEYDSRVRSGYAARTAAATTQTAPRDGYYTQPENIGANIDRLYNTYTTYEATLKPKAEALQSANAEMERLQGELTTQGTKLEQLYSFAQEDDTGIAGAIFEQAKQEYTGLLSDFDANAERADAAWAEYEPLYGKYIEAANAFETYRDEQQKLFNDWKSTIRAEDQIQADEDALDTQIDTLKQQRKELNSQATQLMNMVSGRRGGTQELMDWSAQAGELRTQANELQAQIDELDGSEALLQEERDWAKYYQYADLMEAQDFKTGSAYVSAANGKKRSNWDIVVNNYDDSLSGWDDPLYEYINGNSEAGAYITNQAGALYGAGENALGALFGMATENKSESQQMTEDEVAIFNYLYATQGKEAAHAYYDYLTGDLNYRQRKEEEQYWADYAKESPVGSSVFSVLTAPMKGLSYIAQAADYLGSGTIDQNAAYNRFSYANSAIRNQVSQTIEESGNWGKVGSFAYNTGMSMADFLFNTAVSGGFSGGGSISSAMALGIMGSGAAADTVIISKDRGLSDGESFALGTIAGAAEILTEKFSLDALLKGKWEQSAIKYILKNALTEGSEEVGSDVINLMADVLIAKDKSQWQQTIDAYMAEGKSESEAFGLALAEQAAQMGLDFLGGALSGGIVSSAGAGIGTVQRNAAYEQTGSTLRKMGDEVTQAIIDEGLRSEENTNAYKLAQELQTKLQNGGAVTNTEIGKLFAETGNIGTRESTAPEEEPEGIVLPMAEEADGTAGAENQTPMETPTAQPVITEQREPGMLPTAEEAERQQRMGAATTELERSAIQYGVDEDTLQRVQRIAAAVSRDVVFYDDADTTHNGYYTPKDGIIHVNARSANPVAQIISHELTHSLEKTGSYESFQKLILNRIQQTGGDLRTLRQAKAELYARHGKELADTTEIDYEIVAEYVEKNLLTDEQSIRAIVHQDKALGQRIVNWLNDLLAKLGIASAQERAFLTQARDTYAAALEESQTSFNGETAQAEPAAQQTTDDVLQRTMDMMSHSFGGVNANGADIDALRRAQEMQAQDVAPETIFRETGWYVGADGKWRFEIDDSGMQYSRAGDLNREDRAEYARFRELESKFIEGTISKDEQTELRQLIDEGHGSRRAEEMGTQQLSDFIQHDELFQNYPQLRKASMAFADLEGNTMGAYSLDVNRVTLDTSLRNAPEDVLVHEIQHAIQKAEDFAKGSSPEYWASDAGKTKRAEAVERIQSEISSLEDMLNDGSEAESEDFIRADIEELKEKLDTLSFHLYQNTAGEAEARDAARRRRMTPEQRRQTMPDTGDENTVFAEDADEDLQAIGRTTDDRPFVTVEEDILDGVPEADWIDTVRENLKKKFPNGVTVGNSDIKIDGQSRREMTFSGYMQWLYNNDPQLREDKLRATNNADEILRATTGWVDEGLHHPRKDRILDFARGNVLLRVGNNDYSADVVVGTRKNGTMVLYDVLNLQPTSFTKRETGAAKSTNPSPGAARSTAQVSGDIIREGTDDVNGLPVKRQFSITEPVEQTDRLIAWHNMSEDALQSALELGGLAMPSFAIKPADMVHSDYGDISIIAARESIDPKASRDQKIFGGDAWTPTVPDVSYKASDKVIQRVKEKLDRLVGKHEVRSKISRIGLDSDNMADTLKRNNGNIVEAFGKDEALQFAFLKDTGHDAELPMKEDAIARNSGHDDEIIRRIVDEYGLDRISEIHEKGSTLYREDKSISDRLLEIINGYYREKMDGYDKDLFTDLPFGDYDRLISDAYRYARDGAKQTVDTAALREIIEASIDQTKYEAWLAELFDGIVERRGIRNNADIFTPSGNRRGWNALHSDYTLANIIKEMRKQEQQGVSQLFSGAATVKGAALKTYGDIEAARAERGRLRHTEAEAEAEYEKFKDSVTEVAERMLEGVRSERVGMFEMGDALAETLGKAKTRDGIKRYMQREFGKFYNIYDGIENDVYELYQTANNIPMQYFESKLYRGMPLDEAAAIVVPDTTKPELIGALENAGANVLTYEAGNEDSRLQVVNSIEGAKFSISENVDGTEDTSYDNILHNDARVAWGTDGETYTENDDEMRFTYAIIPAEMLTTSNDGTGSVNPAYPAQLQPRDRTRQSSQMQIQRIARNLNPAKLEASATAQNGAPVVRGDGVVIGGNGRGQAILQAYENGMADRYKDYLQKNAQRFGIERDVLPDNPVLVRVVESSGDWADLARKLNESSIQTYSATEQSMADAKRVGSILDMLAVDEETGSLNTAANKDFISAFISGVAAESERNGMTDAAGMLSQAGLERVQNAVFAKAYGSAELSARLSESLDNDMKNVTNALMATAARAVRLREGIKDGNIYDLDIVDDVIRGVELYEIVKAGGRTVAQWQQQMQLLDDYSPWAQWMAAFLEKNKASSKKIRETLNDLYSEIEGLGDPKQITMFGGGNQDATKQDIFRRAGQRYYDRYGKDSGIGSDTAELEGGNRYRYEDAGRMDGGLEESTGRGAAGREEDSEVHGNVQSAGEDNRQGAAEAERAGAVIEPETVEQELRQVENEDLRKKTTDSFIDDLVEELREASAQERTEQRTTREDVERMRQKDLDDYWESVRRAGDVLEPRTNPEDKVSTRVLPKDMTAKEAAREAYSYFKRKMVDSGEAIARIGKAIKDKSLYHFYNMARASTNAATSFITDERTDIYGKSTGKSLNDVFAGVREKGEDYYKKFQLYLFHMHNIDRMSRFKQSTVDAAQAAFEEFRMTNPELMKFADYQLEQMAYDETSAYNLEAEEYVALRDALRKAEGTRNKPVFGFDVSAEDSKAIADTLLRENAAFAKEAQEVYAYIDNLLRYRVDSGLITEEDYQQLKSVYPHYVPTFRAFERERADTRQKGKVQIGSTIKKASGGTEKLMPLHKALAQQTMSVVREGSKNRFGQRLLNSGAQKTPGAAEHVRNVTEYQSDFHENTFDQQEDEVFKKKNNFIVREDGKLWEIEVSPALYEAVQALSPDTPENNIFTRIVRKGNNLFKGLVTGYNPTFMVRNFMRDLQDAGIYSKDLSEFAKNYPQAVAEITKNGKYWRQYKALGGTYSTMFDYDTGEVNKGSKLKQQTLGRVEALNMAVEQAPRLAEFMATVKKAEAAHGGTATMEELMEAMYNAADITVNFGRSGTLGKVLNANYVPFLNPGIQGFLKMIRNVTETKGAKNWARLAVKAAALGIAPTLLNALLYRDEDDWDEIKDRDKDVYYLFKIGDNLWLKLPKGRTLSLLGMAADRAGDLIQGERVDWAGFIDTAMSQSAPANPLENNILQAWFDTKLFDPDNPGETWYGTDIENQRLQNYAPGERYDASTDLVSKWLGSTFNLSPEKINYLIDQYTGVVGDLLLPLLTPTAERDMFTAAFTIDSVYSNRLSNDFYEKLDELTYTKNGESATGADAAICRYWNRQASAVSDVNAAIREIEADDTLSDSEKKELSRVQYAIRNGLESAALETYERYADAAERHYEESRAADEDDRIDEAYRQANREVLGAEYAIKADNKETYEKAQKLQAESGVSFETFYDYYYDGKAIEETGYEKTNAERNLLRQLDVDDEQKIALYTAYISDTRADDIAAFREAGIDFDTFLQAQNEYSEISNMDAKAGQKRTEFARWVNGQMLTAEQEDVIKDSFTFFSHIPADEGKYEDFLTLGVDETEAYNIATEISELEPPTGKTSVTSEQKWRVVVDSNLPAAEHLKALEAVSDESQYRKFTVAYEMGVEPSAYVSAKEMLPMFDQPNKNGNYGTYTQDEIAAALDSFGTSTTGGIMLPGAEATGTSLTNAQKAVLWQLLTGSTSAKNNPYSTAIGSQVLDAVSTAKGTAADAGSIVLPGAENDTETTGGIVLPMY